jgi:hypothetical protein
MLRICRCRETSLERHSAMRHARCELSDPSRKETPMNGHDVNVAVTMTDACVATTLGSPAGFVDVIAA